MKTWKVLPLALITSCGTPVGIEAVVSDLFVEVGDSTGIDVVTVTDFGNATAFDGPLAITPSDEAVVEVVGRLVTGLAEGTSALTISDGMFETQANVTVVASGTLPQQLVITPEAISCTSDSPDTPLEVFGVFRSGASEDITDLVSFASSSNSVALVTGEGAVVCVSEGTADITVDYLGLTGAIVTTVQPEPPASLEFLPGSLTCKPGIIQPIQLLATDRDGGTRDATFSATYVSGNPAVALASQGEIACIDEGQTRVTAEVQGVVTTIPVIVEAATPSPDELSNLSASPEIIECSPARVASITITAEFADGSTVDLTNSPDTRYLTSNIAVAQASQGQVLCVQVGTAVIEINAGGLATEVVVNVR